MCRDQKMLRRDACAGRKIRCSGPMVRTKLYQHLLGFIPSPVIRHGTQSTSCPITCDGERIYESPPPLPSFSLSIALLSSFKETKKWKLKPFGSFAMCEPKKNKFRCHDRGWGSWDYSPVRKTKIFPHVPCFEVDLWHKSLASTKAISTLFFSTKYIVLRKFTFRIQDQSAKPSCTCWLKMENKHLMGGSEKGGHIHNHVWTWTLWIAIFFPSSADILRMHTHLRRWVGI
jgi:hypothetical protein